MAETVNLEVQCRTRLAMTWIWFCVCVHYMGPVLCLGRGRWMMSGAQSRVNMWAINGYRRLVRVRSRIEGQRTWGRWERLSPRA